MTIQIAWQLSENKEHVNSPHIHSSPLRHPAPPRGHPHPSLPPLAFPGPEPEPETLPPTWRQLCVGREKCKAGEYTKLVFRLWCWFHPKWEKRKAKKITFALQTL